MVLRLLEHRSPWGLWSLVSKELDWEGRPPTRWGPDSWLPSVCKRTASRGPDPAAPFGLLPLEAERIRLCRERNGDSETLVVCSESHSADLLWGLHTGLWAGNWLGEAGGLGARRRGRDRRCEVGPSQGLGVYAPAWETWGGGGAVIAFY